MLIGPSYLPDLLAQLANFVMVIVMVNVYVHKCKHTNDLTAVGNGSNVTI